VVRTLFFCGLVKPARLQMLPNVLAAGHTTSGCSISSLALSFRAPQDGCLARSAKMAFSIGSSVEWEQLCGRRLRIYEPFRPYLIVAIDPTVARWAGDSIRTAQVCY
jgi:hypothetical protein